MLREILWPTPWIFLVRSDTLEKLRSKGLDLPVAIPSQLTRGCDTLSDYVELEVLPGAYLGPGIGAREMEPCAGCGRVGYSSPSYESLRLDPGTIPEGTDLFRLHDLPTYIIASQHFKDACDSLKVSLAEFRPILLGGNCMGYHGAHEEVT